MKYVIMSDFSLCENAFTVRAVSATLLITLCTGRLTRALLRQFVKEMKDMTLRNCVLKEQKASAIFSWYFV